MLFKTLVAQRNPADGDYLRHLLADDKNFEVLAEPTEPVGIAERIAETRPDVLFLDVHLPHHDGLRIAEELRQLPSPAVVFTGTDWSLASRAFELSATDYILKPFKSASLRVALERVRHQLMRSRSDNGRGLAVSGSPEARRQRRRRPRLLVRTCGRTHVLQTPTIDRIESEGNYLRIHWTGGVLRIRERLSVIEEELDPAQFVRVHRCNIVNIDRIVAIELVGAGDRMLHLTGGSQVPVARSRKDVLLAILHAAEDC